MKFASAGEEVTCPNGHLVCTIAKDLVRGEVRNEGATFKNWMQPEPEYGGFPKACEVCGEEWLTGDAICVNREWRHF